MEANKELCLVFWTVKEYGYTFAKARIEIRDATKDDGYSTLYDDLGSVIAEATCASGINRWYGFDIHFDGNKRMSAYECEKALKLLRPIERKMQALHSEHGDADLGQWFARVAAATGCKHILVRNPDAKAEWSSPYQHFSKANGCFRDAIYLINRIGNKLFAECHPESAAA